MTQQANVFDAMGQSYNALQGMSDQRTRNQAGRAYAAGDSAGATNALYAGGMISEGNAASTQQRGEEERARGGRITEALRSPDPSTARALAQTPEELAGIQTFVQNASAQELAAARQRAGSFVAALTAIGSIQDPAQRLAAARQQAPAFGLDPNAITIEQVSPEFLEAQRVQALGLEEYLKYQDREADNRRPMVTPFGILGPAGSAPPAQPQSLGSTIPPGWSAAPPRPNQPPAARPAAVGGERGQPVSVSFPSSRDAQAAIARLVPGVTVTSGARNPDQNRRAGGATGSFHLQDRARDLVPPAGMSMAQLASKMQQAGFRVLDEGDHVHVSW